VTKLLALLRSLIGRQANSRLLSDSLVSFASKIAGAALTFLMLVVFARLMSPQEYGYFGIALNASILVSNLIALGFPVAVLRIYSAHIAKGETALALGFVTFSYVAIAACSAIIVLIAAGLSFSGNLEVFLGSASAALLIALLGTLIALTDYLAGLLRAQGLVGWSALPRDVVWRTLAPLVAIFFAAIGYAISSPHALTIMILTLLAVALTQLKKSLKTLRKVTGNSSAKTDWVAWGRPMPALWAASLLFGLIQQADVIVVGGLLNAQAAASYFAAQKTAALLSLAMIAGGQVAAPMMAAAYHQGNLPELKRLCRLLAIGIAGVTGVGLIFLAVTGKFLLSMFDGSFVAAYPVLLIFAASTTVDAMAGPTAYLMQMTSLEATYLKIMAVCYGLVVTLQFVFVPHFGIVGAALCSAAGVIVWNISAILVLRRRIGVDPSVFSFLQASTKTRT
jgi:O-antigen/teichoic acid export membrane protein